MKLSLRVFLTASALLLPPSLARAEYPTLPQFLRSHGETTAARAELLRQLYTHDMHGDSSGIEQVRLEIASLLVEQGSFAQALSWIHDSRAFVRSDSLKALTSRLSMTALLGLDRPSDAFAYGAAMQQAPYHSMDDEMSRLLGIARVRLGHWTEASQHWARIRTNSRTSVLSAAHLADLADTTELHMLSPAKAGLMGIVPGAGYAYAGYPKSALSALVVTSLFAAVSLDAFDKNQDVLGVFLSGMTISWYAGSIVGGVRSARARNAQSWDAFQNRFIP